MRWCVLTTSSSVPVETRLRRRVVMESTDDWSGRRERSFRGVPSPCCSAGALPGATAGGAWMAPANLASTRRRARSEGGWGVNTPPKGQNSGEGGVLTLHLLPRITGSRLARFWLLSWVEVTGWLASCVRLRRDACDGADAWHRPRHCGARMDSYHTAPPHARARRSASTRDPSTPKRGAANAVPLFSFRASLGCRCR